jgi:hypothetical protein
MSEIKYEITTDLPVGKGLIFKTLEQTRLSINLNFLFGI